MIFAAVLLIADCLESEAVHLIRRVAGGWRNLWLGRATCCGRWRTFWKRPMVSDDEYQRAARFTKNC